MKSLRSAVVVLAVMAVVACVAGSSSAFMKGSHHKDWEEKCQSKIKALQDSAAALQKTDPELAKGLNELAAEKETKLKEMTEMKAKKDAKVKLLKDSAAALRKTNPELSDELLDMSSYHNKGKMGMGKMCPMCMKK